MISNIFLTGDINVGKSTIIDEYIKENKEIYKRISGFKTKELMKNNCLLGYYLEDQLYPKEDFTLVGINKLFPNGRKNEGITEAFNTRGVEILNHAIDSNSDLVRLDELGFFELKADKFKEKVFEILDAKLCVLGVLKKKNNPFLESIKIRKDVVVIEVTKDNRDKIKNQIRHIWRDKYEV
ncbi:hypothetical protein KHQ81_12090 [Mycoplasmatota bacterium]|nr:hypothetical protein KHQ81_12090 [Mycoplasmatota bacterium]